MIKSTICEEDDRTVMYFEGWLDTSEVKKAKKEMGPLFECSDRQIVLDLSGLKYICSGGLRLFIELLKDGRTKGNTLTLTGLSPYITKVFDETGFTRLFKIV